MESLTRLLTETVTSDGFLGVLRAVVVLLVGVLIARLVSRRLSLKRIKSLQGTQAVWVRRLVSWAILAVTFASALRELGFELTALLGAAGILTLAVAFAAQTSVSNLISGLFLMGERPFVSGDLVKVADTTGEVISIDLFSVRLRTFDNLMVRIPNETMLKSSVTNLSSFPIRRIDLQVGVAYKESLPRVKEVLDRVAKESPTCLDEPAPLLIFLGFGSSSLDMQYSVWTRRETFLETRNSMFFGIKEAFDAEGIEIPFPHVSVYTGIVTEPMPLRVVPATTEAAEAAGVPEESTAK